MQNLDNKNANAHKEELQLGWTNNSKTPSWPKSSPSSCCTGLSHGEGSQLATNCAGASWKLSRFHITGLLHVHNQLMEDPWAALLTSPPEWTVYDKVHPVFDPSQLEGVKTPLSIWIFRLFNCNLLCVCGVSTWSINLLTPWRLWDSKPFYLYAK